MNISHLLSNWAVSFSFQKLAALGEEFDQPQKPILERDLVLQLCS